MTLSADIQKLQRHFIPADFVVTTWDNLEPFFKELLDYATFIFIKLYLSIKVVFGIFISITKYKSNSVI